MRVVIVIVLLVVAFFGLPLLAEGTGSPCDAVERKVLGATNEGGFGSMFLGVLQSSLSRGALVTAYVAAQYPNDPPALICTGLYWRALLDPSSLQIRPPALPQAPITPVINPQPVAPPPRQSNIEVVDAHIGRRVSDQGQIFDPGNFLHRPVSVVGVGLDYRNASPGADTVSFSLIGPGGNAIFACSRSVLMAANGSAWCNAHLNLPIGNYVFQAFINDNTVGEYNFHVI
jgi:hypothetical protein